jgi:pimeloyl-ACP methyl ester carboxylesterase
MTSSGDVIANDWWIPTSDGHELHIRQKVADPGADSRRGVLFLPGLFSDGGFFLDSSGRGPATTFLEDGFAIYSASFRGHGRSRHADGINYDWNFDTYVHHDIPDLIRAVSNVHRGPLFLVAHSMAGYAALAALGMEPKLQRRILGVVALSSAVNDYSDGNLAKRVQVTSAALLSRLLGRFPAKALRLGPSDEPPGVMRQFADWAPGGAFRSADQRTDYWRALWQVSVPVLLGVGGQHTYAPDQ